MGILTFGFTFSSKLRLDTQRDKLIFILKIKLYVEIFVVKIMVIEQTRDSNYVNLIKLIVGIINFIILVYNNNYTLYVIPCFSKKRVIK